MKSELREKLCLNRGWLFWEQNIAEAELLNHKQAYSHAKTRSGSRQAQPDYDDSAWKRVDLPHDFVVSHLPEKDQPSYCGCRRRGSAWYRRNFRLDEADRGKNIELVFGAVATSAIVYFNGAPVYRSECGYTGFQCDVTPMAEYGDCLNTIAVYVDADPTEGWWYEGGGIYRDVWLIKRDALHFNTDGIHADPVLENGKKWCLPVEAEISNTGTEKQTARMEAELLSPSGKVIAKGQSESADVPLFRDTALSLSLEIPEPVMLWDLDTPNLYRVRIKLISAEGKVTDEVEQKCGCRTIRFDADHGFFLNGRRVKIKGTCNHQDHAGVGVAVPKSLEKFRLLKLKEMGCNAIRCAHNPPSESLLDLCDELGLMVMDETRHFSTAQEHLEQLVWMVKRDRNHPGIILWSVLNEEPLQGTEIGYQMARKMCEIIRQYDTTRPTTAAMNGGIQTNLNAMMAVDVMGINYYQHEYDNYHALAPGKPVISSEDTSGLAVRGALRTDLEKYQYIDNDNSEVEWGQYHRASWAEIAKREWMAGGFVWTGFDYKGEPNPFSYPANSSLFGILDICGFPKNAFFIRQAFWRDDLAVLRIATHWNRPEAPGTMIRILVISSKADTVELVLNGKSCGKQKCDPVEMNYFDIPFEPGKLEAFSYDAAGNPVAKTEVETTGEPVALVLEPDRRSLSGDGYDLVPVTVYAVDAEGRRVPDAMNHVRFEISENGIISGVGNGNPASLESDVLPERSLFNGYAQVLIRAKESTNGKMILKAESEGLISAEIALEILPDAADRVYAEVPPHYLFLNDWLRSPYYAERPDPLIQLKSYDMNSWEHTTPGHWEHTGDRPYVLFRAEIPSEAQTLIFRSIVGSAEFYMGGKLLQEKTTWDAEEVQLILPAPDLRGDGQLTILMKSYDVGKYCGLSGLVLMMKKIEL